MQPPARLNEQDAQQAFEVLAYSIFEKMLPAVIDIARACPSVPMDVIAMQAIEWAIAESDNRLAGQGWGLKSVVIDLYRDWLQAANITRQRSKPGVKPIEGEHHMTLLLQWADYKRRGYSQKEFCDSRGWNSRKPLTNALKWYENTYQKKFG